MDLLKSMSFSDKYSHRPPIPTAEQILLDFTSSKDRCEIDPVFVLSNGELATIGTNEDELAEKDSSSKMEGHQQKKEICDTYKKVAEFLKQNENLKNSVESMNELSNELQLKKENLTQLIDNIKLSMKDSQRT